jgi:hypothetical protein
LAELVQWKPLNALRSPTEQDTARCSNANAPWRVLSLQPPNTGLSLAYFHVSLALSLSLPFRLTSNNTHEIIKRLVFHTKQHLYIFLSPIPAKMVLKRKRSVTELSSASSSPLSRSSFNSPHSVSGIINPFATIDLSPIHIHSRTLKRFRNSRPSEHEVHGTFFFQQTPAF